MSAAKLKWRNASKDNPGFSVWYTNPEREPTTLYVIRQKKKRPGFTPPGWRVFVRDGIAPESPLQTIYFAQTLKEAKAFVQEMEDTINVQRAD